MTRQKEVNQMQLLQALQKQPPIHIELYPWEVYMLASCCFSWLIFNPGNKTVIAISRKLQTILNYRFTCLQNSIAALLTQGVQDFYESVRNRS
ncbi:MAG: hypothetical protein WBA93_36405 [Microcoleaceae cyanobacterium]